MANYCDGTATLSGPKDTLDRIESLVSRLDDCAMASGFDGDMDWLVHIFEKEYSGEGIFCEGCWRNGDRLEMQIRAKSTDGEDFFRQMATGLDISIEWDYVSDYDGKAYHAAFGPGRGPAWELRPEPGQEAADGAIYTRDEAASIVWQERDTSPLRKRRTSSTR